MGRGGAYEEAQTPALCGCMVQLHGAATRCGRDAEPRCVPAVLLRRIGRECYPQGLSTVWRTYMHVI